MSDQQNPPSGDSANDHDANTQKVGAYLETGVAHAKQFSTDEPISVDRDPSTIVPVSSFRETLMSPDSQPLSRPEERTWEGVFFPALLLCSGWWERWHGSQQRLADAVKWRGDRDLQHWLFSGFEQWGPSWNVNPAEFSDDEFLFGQIGEGDEAESLTIIISGRKLDPIRDRLARGERAFRVHATGILCRRDQLRDTHGLERQLQQWGKSFDYCVVLYPDEKHAEVKTLDEPRLYSGYIWQCVVPKSRATYTYHRDEHGRDQRPPDLNPPDLRDAYFLWEHTNLAKKAATQYNVESLLRKKDYVASKVGELITLQKSAPFIDGDCALPLSRFYEFLKAGVAAGRDDAA
jgi:hypothetical protein